VAQLEEDLLAAEATEKAPQPVFLPERQRSPSPPPHVRRKFNRPPSPPMRQGSTYVNAWDTDKSIQRYASVLQGRSSPFSPQPWPTHPGQEAAANSKKLPPTKEDEEEYTNWADRAEASSRDGDDEDDEADIALLSPKSAARRRASKEKGNRYRHQGVQTDPKITESRGVQVSILTEASKSPVEDSFMPPYRQANIRPRIPAKPSFIPDPKRVSVGTTSTMSDLSTLFEASEVPKPAVGNWPPSTPVLRKRESSEDSVTTAAESSIISSPTKDVEEVVTPRVQIRSPELPPIAGRGSILPGVVRRVGRVFSPTTGVEIFKRGSEEVLARFLTQGPTGWDTARQENGAPGTSTKD
jgi:glycogenin